MDEITRLECLLQADVSWSGPGGNGVEPGRWTPDPFDNCRAFDLCALAEYEGKHRSLCETKPAAEGATEVADKKYIRKLRSTGYS